jgi:hypothetical protein
MGSDPRGLAEWAAFRQLWPSWWGIYYVKGVYGISVPLCVECGLPIRTQGRKHNGKESDDRAFYRQWHADRSNWVDNKSDTETRLINLETQWLRRSLERHIYRLTPFAFGNPRVIQRQWLSQMSQWFLLNFIRVDRFTINVSPNINMKVMRLPNHHHLCNNRFDHDHYH